jgi:hypothetical protein
VRAPPSPATMIFRPKLAIPYASTTGCWNCRPDHSGTYKRTVLSIVPSPIYSRPKQETFRHACLSRSAMQVTLSLFHLHLCRRQFCPCNSTYRNPAPFAFRLCTLWSASFPYYRMSATCRVSFTSKTKYSHVARAYAQPPHRCPAMQSRASPHPTKT